VGSGFTTHNLRWFNPGAGPDGIPPQASAEFDHWAAEALENKDIDALLNFWDQAPAAHEAHPRIEHWAPLYVALGAALETGLDNSSAIEGFWYGLSKRSWQFS
jgi:4,5-DOPA dioxygenase extradiol